MSAQQLRITLAGRECVADAGTTAGGLFLLNGTYAASMAYPVPEKPVPQDGAGVPDGFQRLWMPHRMAYIKGENRVVGTGTEGCPFCQIPRLDDAGGLIVARGTLVFTVLNLYPYNAGHLMVCPYRHVADYTELDEAETTELAEHTKLAMTALRAASGAQGFNIGMNMGNVAGAGISAHLHQHVVPRWGGDTNFLPVISATKVLPQLLSETREMIAAAWPGRPAEPGGTGRP